MKKRKDLEQPVLEKLVSSILSLSFVYGPIHMDELVNKIDHYFPELYFEISDESIIRGVIFQLGEFKQIRINDYNEVSVLSQKDMDELLQNPEIRMIYYSQIEKDFNNPDEILQYESYESIRIHPTMRKIEEYFKSINLKKGVYVDDPLLDCFMIAFKMADEEQFINELKKNHKELDNQLIHRFIDELTGTLPRGFLHGYSFKEIGEKANSEHHFFENLVQNHIEKKIDDKSYSSYTYEECVSLTEELKKTKIFEYFCSDNLIELLIHGEEIFVQLLGYYNHDRNIIIYGNRSKMEYNYYFMNCEADDYPDIVNRLNYSEILIDDPEGFLTDDIQYELRKRNLPMTPLICDLHHNDKPTLSNIENLNLIGTVLEQLLSIYHDLEESIGERCEKGNPYKIIQFYLYEKSFEIGDYQDLELTDPKLPYKVKQDYQNIIPKVNNKTPIQIGLFSVSIENQEEATYITILLDERTGLIIGHILKKESEMDSILKDVILLLEELDIEPNHLVFNNQFCFETFDGLLDFYGLASKYSFDNQLMNEIFSQFMSIPSNHKEKPMMS
ncbi:MAG: hypothetical protein IKE51_04160 [Solobacterium sp.]|nr:hypothetical protein [Solobacterium sp.]